MPLSRNEIPTKWRGNEIPTNRLLELYTIYNPAACKWPKSLGWVGGGVRTKFSVQLWSQAEQYPTKREGGGPPFHL